MTPLLYVLAIGCLPEKFTFKVVEGGDATSFRAFVCCALGLWSGLVIGYFTEYYTSTNYWPV